MADTHSVGKRPDYEDEEFSDGGDGGGGGGSVRGFSSLACCRRVSSPFSFTAFYNSNSLLSSPLLNKRMKHDVPEHTLDSSPIPSHTSAEIHPPSVSNNLSVALMMMRPRQPVQGSLRTKR